MKKFQMLRYIKRLRYLIVLITLIGSMGIYWYANKNQIYTAQTVIKYTNQTAEDGKVPDGTNIQPKEIYSASVITDVIKELGLGVNVDTIRSACSVEEVVTEDEKRRKEAILDKGEAFTDVCTTYKLTFKVGNTYSKAYARNVLDSIINNYYVFYSQKYVDTSVIPNNVLNVSADKYDYLSCVELLESSVKDISEYLGKKKSVYNNFRSVRTGYSFEDLQEQYDFIKENVIPVYYATVIGERLTKNREELLKNYQNRCVNAELESINYADHIIKQKKLVDQFGKKVTKAESQIAGAIGDETDAIIKNVDDRDGKSVINADTTYDELIEKYVLLRSQKNMTDSEHEYCEKILATFSDATVVNDTGSDSVRELMDNMQSTIDKLNKLYKEVETTLNEQNEYSGARNITTLTGTFVKQAINVDLYLIMAIFLFLIVGCAGAIAIGRLGDFWEYFLYTDKKAGTANRVRCDMVIDEYSKQPLTEGFSCIVFKLIYLQNTNKDMGRNYGDKLLFKFGQILNKVAETYGFVGYNNGDMFMALFQNCSLSRAESFIDSVNKEIERSVSNDEESALEFKFGIAESSSDDLYDLRRLLKLAISRLFK